MSRHYREYADYLEDQATGITQEEWEEQRESDRRGGQKMAREALAKQAAAKATAEQAKVDAARFESENPTFL